MEASGNQLATISKPYRHKAICFCAPTGDRPPAAVPGSRPANPPAAVFREQQSCPPYVYYVYDAETLKAGTRRDIPECDDNTKY